MKVQAQAINLALRITSTAVVLHVCGRPFGAGRSGLLSARTPSTHPMLSRQTLQQQMTHVLNLHVGWRIRNPCEARLPIYSSDGRNTRQIF